MTDTGKGTGRPVARPSRDLLLHWCEHSEDLQLIGRRHLVETDPPPEQTRDNDDVRRSDRPTDDSS